MISPHLPALQIVLPLIAAPLSMVVRNATLAWALSLAVTWASLAIAVTLLLQVGESGPISYPIGNWAAPWGIEYRVDRIGALVLVLVAAIGSVCMPFARASVEREVAHDRVYLFYTMYLLCLTGLLGIAITGDAFNLFVFLEISSLSSYVLISLGNDRRALVAAYRYLVLGTIGATFYLIGVGLLYMMTGTLNMADLAARLPEVAANRTVLAAFAFLVIGLGLKLALFPLHVWLPNAYAYAPSVVTAFLAATATKVALYALIRVLFTVFGGIDAFDALPVGGLLLGLALPAMFVGSLVAIFQTDVKRLLAYSSIAQIGYMVLGLSLASVSGVAGTIIHLFNHSLMKGALFMAMGCVVMRIGGAGIDGMAGLGRIMPWTMGAFVAAGLSLIGVPFTVGFVSKWMLIRAALEQGWWPVAGLIVASSLLAVVYVWRVVEVAYFRPPPDGATTAEAPLLMLASTWTLAAASIYFGINATPVLEVALAAARTLTGVHP